jgi:hypothetical protein
VLADMDGVRRDLRAEHGKPRVWDVRGEAMCKEGGTFWRSKRDSTVEIGT